jgi:hypothetical protein
MKLWIPVFTLLALQAVWPAPAAAQAPPLAAFAPCPWGSADCNVCVADAVDAITSLRRHGDAMGFHMNGTPDVEFDHHWQGVQRLMGGGGRYLAISRSLASLSTDVSFVVVDMATRNGNGQRFRSNRLDPSFHIPVTAPPLADRVVFSMAREGEFDHAGGMQALGNVLAVPYEGGPGSRVVFYDVSNPIAPVRLDNVVDHSPLSDEAGTATLAKLQNGRFLLVIGRANANILDFYVSSGTDLRTTAFEFFDTWEEGELTGDDSEFGNYQNLNFLPQCNGSLFLIGTHRNAAGGFGDDFIDLFRVTNGDGSNVAIEKVARKHLFCSGNCDFDAAGGIYVDPAGQLVVYGTTHDNDGVPVNGFGPLQCAGALQHRVRGIPPRAARHVRSRRRRMGGAVRQCRVRRSEFDDRLRGPRTGGLLELRSRRGVRGQDVVGPLVSAARRRVPAVGEQEFVRRRLPGPGREVI